MSIFILSNIFFYIILTLFFSAFVRHFCLFLFLNVFFFTFFFLKIVFYFEIWINSNELSHSVDRMLWFVVRCVYFSIWFSRHPLSRLQMQVPLWDNRSGIPARDAWGRFVAERHRVQWPNLTFEMAASVRFSSKRYCRAEIVMFCLFFCIFSRFFFKIFKIFQDFSRFFKIFQDFSRFRTVWVDFGRFG